MEIRRAPTSYNLNKSLILNSVFENLYSQLAAKIVARFCKEASSTPEAKKKGDGKKAIHKPPTKFVESEDDSAPKQCSWHDFPHSLSFYNPALKLLSDPSMDIGLLVDLVVDWLPTQHFSEMASLGFPHFASKVSSTPLPGRQLDIVELVVETVVVDILVSSFCSNPTAAATVGTTRCERLYDIALATFKPKKPRAVESQTFNYFRNQILAQWSVLFSRISSQLIGKQKLSDFLPSPTADIELLHRLRFQELDLSGNTQREQAGALCQKLVMSICNARDKQVVRGQLMILTSMLLSVNFHDKPMLWVKIAIDPKVLTKLAKNEELDQLVSRYQAAMLVHGPAQNYITSNLPFRFRPMAL